jgi:hypothetical protein
MKTLIIYNPLDSELQCVIVDGDYSRFHGVVVNSMNGNGFEDEFVNFLFNKDDGNFNFEMSPGKSLIENKDWDKVAITTWIP